MKESFIPRTPEKWRLEAEPYLKTGVRSQADFLVFATQHIRDHREAIVFAVVMLMKALHDGDPLSLSFIELRKCMTDIDLGTCIEHVCTYSGQSEEALSDLREEFEQFFEDKNGEKAGWVLNPATSLN